MELDRRTACLGASALFASVALGSRALAADCALDARVLEVPGERLARRCQLFVPRDLRSPRRLLVLLHGLGETSSEALGIRAWADRYGLCTAYERLKNPPVARVLTDAVYLTDSRLTELNRDLAEQPFHGLSLVCPFTPNVYRAGAASSVLDRYTAWLVDGVLPAVRRELGGGSLSVGLDGVSLGGYVALEVFTRRPEAFATAGSLQGAFGQERAAGYAERIERALAASGPRPLRIATSRGDPGRAASERLVERLERRGISATLSVPPGPHDQRFLREAGTLELLVWHDRALPHPRP